MSSLLQVTTTTTLLAVVLLFLAPPTTNADNLVVDSKGDPLVAGQYYYAMPIATQKGGGLTMFNNGPVWCPDFIVARSTKYMDLGIPIKISPQTQGPIKNNIYTSSNLSIAFKYLSPQPMCRRFYSTVWAVGTAEVVLNGQEGSDASLFKLEEYGDHGYKILTKDNKALLYKEQAYNGEVLVGVDNGNPLYVVFVKLMNGEEQAYEW